jgi:hypothetical protein
MNECRFCYHIRSNEYCYVYHISTHKNSKYLSTHTYSYYRYINKYKLLSLLPIKNDGRFECVCSSPIYQELNIKYPVQILLSLSFLNTSNASDRLNGVYSIFPKDIIRLIMKICIDLWDKENGNINKIDYKIRQLPKINKGS